MFSSTMTKRLGVGAGKDTPVNDWIINQNIKHFKGLLATDLDDAGRATITNLLKLEREKTPRLLPRAL